MTITSLIGVRAIVKAILDANLVDPEARADTSWIIGEFPDKTVFPGWPLVTIGHPTTGESVRSLGIGAGSRVVRPVSVVLMVYTKSGLQHEILLSAVETALYTGESVALAAKMHSMSVTFGDGDLFDNEENVYVTPVTVEFLG